MNMKDGVVTAVSAVSSVNCIRDARFKARPLAHVTIIFFSPLVFLPTACIFSAIFSQTRGTPRKNVGLTYVRRFPIVPSFKSFVLAK